ncbi:hypothetical protein [Clostridium sp. LP20]|uniref:hypothetical protein n=1 Tax=Clostridium sp. LP20 TaxID=3418665 RepID=UPI003EE468C3
MKSISKNRAIIIQVILILLSVISAIVVHAILPAPVEVVQFDSIFVKAFGFPAVAVFYFLLIFSQCAIVVRYVGIRSNVTRLQIGFRFGIAFAIIYLVGMQEVVVEGSPFTTWGLDFIKYQLFMGLGDGIPAIFLCIFTVYFTLRDNEKIKVIHKLSIIKIIKAVIIIGIAIFAERIIGYESGLISSNLSTYPVQCYIWTGIFGIMFGYIYVLLRPLLEFEKKKYSITLRFIAIMGVNWIIFNSFIGLISKGAMSQMILRSGLDVLVLFLASMLVEKYILEVKEG